MKADAAFWKTLKFFKREEQAFGRPGVNAWGDPNQIEQELLFRLDIFRAFVGKPVLIHAAWAADGHAADSAHYRGEAVDCHVQGLSLIDSWIQAERFGWGGIGLYPLWANSGLHLDVRSRGPNQAEARWWRDAAGTYQNLTSNAVYEMLQTERARRGNS